MTAPDRFVSRDDLVSLLAEIEGLRFSDTVETAGDDGDPAGPCFIEYSLKSERPDIWRAVDRMLFRLRSGDVVRD